MEYLKDISFEQLNELFDELLNGMPCLESEEVSVFDVKGRVLSEDLYIKEDVPSFNYALKDGVSINIKDLSKKGALLKIDDYKKVNKGDRVEDKYNAVIDKKKVIHKEYSLYLNYYPSMFENIKYKGEDTLKGSFLYHKDTLINGEEAGVLIASGIKKVKVYRKPRVSMIPTIDMVSDRRNKTSDNDSIILKGKMNLERVDLNISDPLKEDKRDFERVIKSAAMSSDVVLILGKTGEGNNDYTFDTMSKLGRVYFRGVRINPGSGFVLGKIENALVFGIPGDNISTIMIYDRFVSRLISKLSVTDTKKDKTLYAALLSDTPSSPYCKDFVFVNLFLYNENYYALPIYEVNSAADYLKADGYFISKEKQTLLNRGESLEIHLLKDRKDINKNILFTGRKNHFNTSLSNFSENKRSEISLVLSQDKSLAESYIESREYFLKDFENKFDYFKEELNKGKVIIEGASERYGFATNKKYLEIVSVTDLVSKDVKIGNLPKNTFSRSSLEGLLKAKNINHGDIKGFGENVYKNEKVLLSALLEDKIDICFISEREVKNHKSIKFIPIIVKENDFIINCEDKALIDMIQSIFTDESLKGFLSEDYDTENLGKISRIER
ncbi:substrate-binding domain-containing protein [Anaerofustis stercorihominis]|uniref:substrate-binding domain-containing protein n=1 Tax=Anaerofustis stercorihominis TaxID=214853 RepID=UPI003996AB6B